MKTLLLITLFSISLHGQKSNEPEIVYPLLEQFISEAYSRDIPVYHDGVLSAADMAGLAASI